MALSTENREFVRGHATAFAGGNSEYGEWFVETFADDAASLDDLPSHTAECAYLAFMEARDAVPKGGKA